jgi:PIN domain nuclease of toxin-antitoxin system
VTDVVLDASALMALLRNEPGADIVAASLTHAIISAVNYSEVLKKAVEHDGGTEKAVGLVASLGVPIIPFDAAIAVTSAALYPNAKKLGLSFADRACLALGVQRRAHVFTADTKWQRMELPIKVKLIRNAH